MYKYQPEVVVGGIIFNNKYEILLISSHKWSGLYSIPGGHIEYGETIEAGLTREIAEETCLKIKNIEFSSIQESIMDNTFYRNTHIIMLNYTCQTDNEVVILSSEGEKYAWVSVEEALKYPIDSHTREALQQVARTKLAESELNNSQS